MRIVFFGTPDFAVGSLDKLHTNGCNIVAVVTAPDKPSGRGLQLQSSAVKQYCLANNLKVLQPSNLKDEHFLNELNLLQADLQLVVAFRMLPEVVWNMPPLGTYNLHASLLPKYRGAAPINWSIINGEKETGVTTFKLQHQIDTGNILFQEKVDIDIEMNAGELHDKLMHVGSELLYKTVKTIEHAFNIKEELLFIPQQEQLVSHAPKLYKANCLINWNNTVIVLHNFIRGLSPFPGAYSLLNNGDGELKNFKIYKSIFVLDKHTYTNGCLITDNKSYLRVYAKEGYLDLIDIQLEGKKRMHVAAFLKGFSLNDGAKLQ